MDGLGGGSPGTALVPLVAQREPSRAWLAFRDSYREGASRAGMTAALKAGAALLAPGADPARLPWHQLRYEHVRALAARMAELGWSPATQQIRLGAVRRMVEECWKVGLVDRDTFERIRSVRSQKRDVNAPLSGRVLEPAEQEALFTAAMAGKGDAAARDLAVVSLALYAGLRREELAGLPAWEGELGYSVTKMSVVVKGKGGKVRAIPVSTATLQRMRPWMELRGDRPGPLLWRLNSNSYHGPRRALEGVGVTATGIYSLLGDIGFRAKLKDFSPHDLRRTFITELLERGVDSITVARLAGHEDVKTTMRYDRRGERAMQAAIEALEQPRQAPRQDPAPGK